MFHSDDATLDFMESELIMYVAIACQGLQATVQNHLGELLRMGLSVEQVEQVAECGEMVARWT